MAGRKRSRPNEVVDLDQTFMSIAGSTSPKPKKRSASTVLVSIACVILLISILAGVWLLFSDNWLTMDSVTIAGVDLTGMTKKDAKAALQASFDRYKTTPVTVTVLDTTLEVEPAAVAATLKVSDAIDEAYWYPERFDIKNFFTFNEGAIKTVVNQLGAKYNADLVETVCLVEGQMPSLAPDAEDTEGQTLVVRIGAPEMGLDTNVLYEQIVQAYLSGSFEVTGECTVIPPEVPAAEALYEEYLTAPVDAVMDPVTFQITPENFGYSIDVKAAAELLAQTEYNQEIRIPFVKLPAEVTEADLAGLLFQDILGECSTPYSGSDTNNRNTNLHLSCDKMNGVIILPGEKFSYNLCLGERTAANGWKPAASYVGGETVDTYGGGICQGSSTLYNCVLLADLKINQRYNHGYISSYTKPGLDATVSWGVVDFVFTNSTNWPIKLEAYCKNGQYTVKIYGTDEKDYYVKMSYKITETTPYEDTVLEVPVDNNPKGYKDGQVITTPYTGYIVYTYKSRYDKETNKLIETVQEARNVYSKRDRVTVKLITPADTTPTEPSAAAATE